MGYKDTYPELLREAGFKLREYCDGPLDWRRMGSYDTDRILREQNLNLVDEALQHLSEAPLGSMLETHVLDSGIAKYFVMSQYAIQYLLYCRTFLDETVADLRESHTKGQQEIVKLRRQLADCNDEIVQLNRKITQIETIREVVYPCHLCSKSFISNETLNIHLDSKHGYSLGRVRPQTPSGVSSNKTNDIHLINTIKMELEIKQLKERLNDAERCIKERNSSSSKKQSSRDESKPTSMCTVGIQSNLMDVKEKDEISSEALNSEYSERKNQLHGLAERISNFEAWQVQLQETNEHFFGDINQKLENLSTALEQTKQRAEQKATAAPPPTPTEERVATPSLEDLERILSEKVTEIGKVSANKLEEVVHKLEVSYKSKLEALERELKELSIHKEVPMVQAAPSKIPKPRTSTTTVKPVARTEQTSMERIKQQVESGFFKTKQDDDTYSIEDAHPPIQKHELPIKTVTQVQEIQSGGSSSPHTYTKHKDVPKTTVAQIESHDMTDVSDSLSESMSEEESLSDEGSELLPSEPEPETEPEVAQKPSPKSKTLGTPKMPQIRLTRRDASKLVNMKLRSHGFSMKSKTISNAMLKRVNLGLVDNRKELKLRYPHFYATRNNLKSFVDKLCSVKMSPRAEVLLKHKTPFQPMTPPKRPGLMNSSTSTTTQNLQDESNNYSDTEAETTSEQSRSATPDQRLNRELKSQLEQMLVKPIPRTRPGLVKPAMRTGQLHQSNMKEKPVPTPRKRVMFNTQAKSIDESEEDLN